MELKYVWSCKLAKYVYQLLGSVSVKTSDIYDGRADPPTLTPIYTSHPIVYGEGDLSWAKRTAEHYNLEIPMKPDQIKVNTK